MAHFDFIKIPAVQLQFGDHVSAPAADDTRVVLHDVSHVATVGGLVRFHAAVKLGGGVREVHHIGRDVEVTVLRFME